MTKLIWVCCPLLVPGPGTRAHLFWSVTLPGRGPVTIELLLEDLPLGRGGVQRKVLLASAVFKCLHLKITTMPTQHVLSLRIEGGLFFSKAEQFSKN